MHGQLWYGRIDVVNSYCPMRNTSYISKTAENVSLLSVSQTIVSAWNLFHQFAYRAHRSAETAILSIYDALVHSIDSTNVSRSCYAAIDTVDHVILPSALKTRIPVHGIVFSWFQSYLPYCILSFVYGSQTETFSVGQGRIQKLWVQRWLGSG